MRFKFQIGGERSEKIGREINKKKRDRQYRRKLKVEEERARRKERCEKV